jgi:hypothetical protein
MPNNPNDPDSEEITTIFIKELENLDMLNC